MTLFIISQLLQWYNGIVLWHVCMLNVVTYCHYSMAIEWSNRKLFFCYALSFGWVGYTTCTGFGDLGGISKHKIFSPKPGPASQIVSHTLCVWRLMIRLEQGSRSASVQSTHSTKSHIYHCGAILHRRVRLWVDPRLKSKHILGLAFRFTFQRLDVVITYSRDVLQLYHNCTGLVWWSYPEYE